jgi:hypothetical protein|tara:strand:- start:1205 stop:2161 length:957 start_codon:yes stop_codon:yes gene_type:complete
MAKEDKDWGSVEVPENETTEDKIEYEVEEESKVEAKEETVVESPEELEGIETKGAQKRIRQLVKQRKERDEQIHQLMQQNEQLQTTVHQTQNTFEEVSKKNLDVTEKQLTDKLTLARTAYTDAFESGDKDKLLHSQEMLNDAQTDLKNVNATKQQFNRRVQQEQRQPVQQQYRQPVQPAQPAGDPLATEWSQKNTWFGTDNIMTAGALAIDAALKEEGYNTDEVDYYQEVDKRMKENFPQKFNGKVETNRTQEVTSQPAQVVAGASRSASNSKKVKLSQHDLNLANKWNIPLDKYAQEKMKAEKAEGEYTTVNMKRGG